jgi:plastocyanin
MPPSGFVATVALLALFGLPACGVEKSPPSARETGGRSQPSQGTSNTPEPALTPSAESSTQPNSGDVQARVIDTDFRPLSVEVKAGSSVDWTQIGDQPHSVTAVDGSFDSSPDCGPLDSDMCLGEGDTFSHNFDRAGTFDYYCRVHGLPDGTGMFGTVVVK